MLTNFPLALVSEHNLSPKWISGNYQTETVTVDDEIEIEDQLNVVKITADKYISASNESSLHIIFVRAEIMGVLEHELQQLYFQI